MAGVRDEVDRSPAVTRSLRVLTLLEQAQGEPLGVSAMACELSMAKSSLTNICLALTEGGLIQRRGNGYQLGRRLVELGGAYLRSKDPVQEFYRVCSEAPLLRHEICQLAVLDGTDVLYLAAHTGRSPLRLTASIGSRFPASITAVGNALLSLMSDDELRQRFALPETRPAWTKRSITSLDDLMTKLEQTRARGYALDDGEVFPSILGIAMPIEPYQSGEPALSMGVSLMNHDGSEPSCRQILAEMQDAIQAISNPMNLASSLPSSSVPGARSKGDGELYSNSTTSQEGV